VAFGDAAPIAHSYRLLARMEVRKLMSVLKMGKRGKEATGGRKALAPPLHYVDGLYRRRPVLSRAEEARYARACKAGDVEACQVLALSVAPLVVHICNRWQLPPGVERNELIQDAHLAVSRALNRGSFNPSKGRRLTTWAYQQVKWACLRAVEKARRLHIGQFPNPDLVTDTRPSLTEEVDRLDEQDRWLQAVFARCEKLGRRYPAVLKARGKGLTYWQIGQDRAIFPRPVGEERVRQIERKATEFIRQSVLADEGME
jgi:RNA polymerase sigma factor (sigma-70 family)